MEITRFVMGLSTYLPSFRITACHSASSPSHVAVLSVSLGFIFTGLPSVPIFPLMPKRFCDYEITDTLECMCVCVCVLEQLSILVQFKNSWSTQGQFVDTQVHVLISDMVPLTWITCFNYGTFQSFPPPSWLVRELSSEDQVYRHFKGCGRWQSVFYPWLITWPRPAPVKHVPAAGGFLKIVIYLFFKYTQSNVHREKIQ